MPIGGYSQQQLSDPPDHSEEPTMTSNEAIQHIHTWRDRLSDQTVVSASEVQDRLFDLYGDLEPYPQLDLLKPWISLTIQRELFSADELNQFLDELSAELHVDGEQPA